MGELSGRFAVELHDFASQLPQQLGYDDAADGVHRIHDHLEAPPPHGFRIDQRQGQHPADMLVVVRLPRNDLADMVHIRENETLVFGQRQHPLALGVAQKFSLGIQELQGVPLAGVVRCGDDDAAVGPVRRNGQFGSRRSAESDVHYVRAATQQRAFDDVADHFARNTGVAAHDDFEPFPGCGFGDETHVGGGEFNDIERGEVLRRRAADRPPDAGNGFDESHVAISLFLYSAERDTIYLCKIYRGVFFEIRGKCSTFMPIMKI